MRPRRRGYHPPHLNPRSCLAQQGDSPSQCARIGSSCPDLRLDAVVIDADARLVHGEFPDPHGPEICTAALVGGKTFVVAVARDQLLRLHAEPIGCEPDCGMGPSTLEVDLR